MYNCFIHIAKCLKRLSFWHLQLIFLLNYVHLRINHCIVSLLTLTDFSVSFSWWYSEAAIEAMYCDAINITIQMVKQNRQSKTLKWFDYYITILIERQNNYHQWQNNVYRNNENGKSLWKVKVTLTGIKKKITLI